MEVLSKVLKRVSSSKFTRQVIPELLLSILLSAGVFALVLSVNIPPQITRVFASDNLFLLMTVTLFFPVYGSLRLPGKKGKIISILFIFALTALPLRLHWQGDLPVYGTVGGLLPWSDARGYYSNMLKFINGNSIGRYSVEASRTIYVSQISLLLTITSQNLQLALALAAYLSGVSFYYLLKVLKTIWGPLLASAVFFVIYPFHRETAGVMYSELLGLPVGVFAFAFMLKNIYYKNTWLVAAGFLLVTLALQIRPGALFIIPALWIWAMYSYKDRYSLGLRILIFTLPILAGFGVNWYIPRFFGVPSPLRMRSIPNQFLRIVTGGGNPQTIISRFPELDNIPIPAEKTRATYNLAWNLFTANPLKSFQGLFNNYKNYYSSDRLGGFFFAFGSNKFFTTLAFLLTGYAVSMTAALRRRPLYGFLFSAILGLFASVPLINWVGFRSHAGSIIVLVLLMCLGMLWLFRWPDMTEKESETRENSFVGMNIAALIIVGSLCLSPLLVRLISKPVTSFTEPTCAPGEMYVTTRIKSGSYLIITKDQDNNLALPFIPLSDFKKSLRIKEIFDFKNYLMKVEPETILMNAYDLRTGSNLTNWMLSKRNIFPDKEGIFSACGTFALAGSDNQIFLVSSWQKTQ